MDTIRSYIDHMFRSLPRTSEVSMAQGELQQICEDRYNELRAEGISENEAVGRVITQFGDLDELADELGIRSEVDGRANDEDSRLDISNDEAERYLRVSRSASRFIALGIFLVLLGASSLIYLNQANFAEFDSSNPLALTIFFVGVAIAVALFIVAGMSMGRFERFEGRALRLDSEAIAKYETTREAGYNRHMVQIVLGVIIIIIGFASAAVGGGLRGGEGSAQLPTIMVALTPVIISIGVGILVIAGMRRGALDRLTSQGDYTPKAQKQEALIGRVAGPYWMLMVVIFLAWSFIGSAWHISWIIWPIAGVLFAFIAVTINAIVGDKDKKSVR